MSMIAMVDAEPGRLERELWLLALCWTVGWSISRVFVNHVLDGLARTHSIRAQA